ncbi:MAG TPA: glycoside hydrolase family 9 protein [Woeseiaceae bacterium]|nr:glycoside hydrolase family 9 protein [Woeseiaceae bacterium]
MTGRRSATCSPIIGILLLAAGNGHAACEEIAVRLNQAGFYPDAAKRAVVSSPSLAPLEWKLTDRQGETVHRGTTSVFGEDAASGEHVHLVDFSDYREKGEGFRIESGCVASHPFDIADAPYGDLKFDAFAYFYHNRSNVPIDAAFAGTKWARPAGHPQETASCRSGVDGHGNEWPGCDYTLDLTGGWYDAGDHGKYVVNAGITVWTLLNVYERQKALRKPDTFADARAAIPEADNGTNDLLDEVRVELEFLLRMQAPPEATAQVPVGVKANQENLRFDTIDAGGMAHHKIADENWTPLPVPPHLDDEERVLYPVSTAATLNLAATAAQCARIWRTIDEVFADRCRNAAERAYAAAVRNPEVYFIADFEGSGMYGDSNLDDEFFWAAAELFVTTGEHRYYDALSSSTHFRAPIRVEPSWPRVAQLGVISLALVPNRLSSEEVEALRARLLNAAIRFREQRRRSGYHIPYNAAYPWGSNSNILNRAIILALAHDFTGNEEYRSAVIDAMDYVLGRNPLDQSYVAGYGERPLQNPHHRFWAPSLDPSLPPPPPGALSGGPNSTSAPDVVAQELREKECAPQTCWRDDIRAYSLNEVAINWNAPLVWVATWLDE